MSYLQPSTWRALGLSVGVGYAGFGLWQALYPRQALKTIYDIDAPETTESGKAANLLDQVLGWRDLAVAAAIFTFFYRREDRAMGIVIASGTLLCYADVAAVYVRKGLAPALQMATGASIWAGIGLALISTRADRVITLP